MSKFDECIQKYKQEFEGLGISVDHDLLVKVTKGCGPAIYNPDSSKVSSSDKKELDRVRNNFLIKKLGCRREECDEAITTVIRQMGSRNKNKYRAMFYYLLVKKLGKESAY